MSDSPIEPFAWSPHSSGTPIACIACPPHNVDMQLTGVHPARRGLYVHLVCSNGHSQRLVIRPAKRHVLIEMALAPRPIPPRRGEIVH
jgi:hypothetical protein